jgi:hypothetical protein
MEDSDLSKKKDTDARTFTFSDFRSQFRKQSFDDCSFDPPAGCRQVKNPVESGFVFALHVLMIFFLILYQSFPVAITPIKQPKFVVVMGAVAENSSRQKRGKVAFPPSFQSFLQAANPAACSE